ncbi:hypothetical protein ACOSP7_006439 [Xanthoceras sorbifolium]
MSASAKRPRTEDPSTVNISVKSQDGNQMFFMIKRHVPIKKLLSNYCEKKFLEYNTVHFLIDGNRFSHAKTPAQLGLENGDQIDALMQVDGGGGCCSDSIITTATIN